MGDQSPPVALWRKENVCGSGDQTGGGGACLISLAWVLDFHTTDFDVYILMLRVYS